MKMNLQVRLEFYSDDDASSPEFYKLIKTFTKSSDAEKGYHLINNFKKEKIDKKGYHVILSMYEVYSKEQAEFFGSPNHLVYRRDLDENK